MQQLGFGQIHLDQVGLEFLDHLLQRRCDFRHRQDAGHVRTTLERVQGTLQRIGHRLRQALGAIGEKTDQRGQMRFGFVAKNFQQLGVQCVVIVLRRRGRGRLVRNRSRRLGRLRKHH